MSFKKERTENEEKRRLKSLSLLQVCAVMMTAKCANLPLPFDTKLNWRRQNIGMYFLEAACQGSAA